MYETFGRDAAYSPTTYIIPLTSKVELGFTLVGLLKGCVHIYKIHVRIHIYVQQLDS